MSRFPPALPQGAMAGHPPSPARSWRPLACALGLGALLLATTLATPWRQVEAGEALVDAQFPNFTDSLGFNWDVNNTGMVADGSNDCFDGGMVLRIDNWNFQVSEPPKMTKDGRTFVLTGRNGDIEVIRRITVDLQAAAVRSVETVRNRGAQRQQVQLSIGSQLGGNCQSAGTNEKAQAMGPALDRKEHTVYAFQPPGGRPSVFWCVRAPRNRNAPSYSVSNQRYFNYTWPLDLQPGRTISVLITVGQRRWAAVPSSKELEKEMKPFLQARWAQGLPQDIASSLLNFHAAPEASLDGPEPVLGELLALASALEVQRGEDSHLVFPETMPLSGTVAGNAFVISTRHGERTVALEEIAAVRGSAGRGRTPRMYLRNGEILVGQVRTQGLGLTTSAGLSLPLRPEALDTLFLPLREGEGEPEEAAKAFVTLLDGTRLSLGEARNAALEATTPWGRLIVPGGEVVRLLHAPEPVPGMWAALADGSRFPFLPGGEAMELASLHFGAVRMAASHIAAWSVTHDPRPPLPLIELPRAAPPPAAAPVEDPNTEGPSPGAEPAGETDPQPQPAAAGEPVAEPILEPPQFITGPRPPPDVPYARLMGDTLITATVEAEQIRLMTAAGPIGLELARIVALKRVEEGSDFDVLLVGGGAPLRARMVDASLTLRTRWGTLHVPQRHIELLAVDAKALAELEAEAARLAALVPQAAAAVVVEEDIDEEMIEETIMPMPVMPPAPPGRRRP